MKIAYETIKIEIDEEVCQQAQQILKSHHLTMKQAIQMFFLWVVQNPDGAKAELKRWKDAKKEMKIRMICLQNAFMLTA